MALQDFGSLSLTNTPTGAQDKAPAPAGQRRGGTTPLDAATVDRIIAEEGATAIRPTVMGIYGQESGSGTNARTSVDGAIGPMQVMRDTFNRLKRGNERVDSPEDNFRVGVRYLKTMADQFGNDPGRLAAGYFSGEGNVSASGDTPYKEDRKDGNGKYVSSYVRDVVARVGNAVVPSAKAAEPAPDISKSPKYRDFIAKPQWAGLDDAQKEQARGAYFDRYVSPHLSAGERENQRAAFMSRATAIEGEATKKPEQPGVMGRIMDAGRAVLGAMGQGEATPEGAAINPSALASPAAPASKIGVMGDAPAPAAAPTTSRAPVTPQFRDQVNRAYDAATPAERQRMAQADGVVGQLVRERSGQFDAAPQTPAAGKFDTRAEARSGRLAADGADHQTADTFARTGAERGVAPGSELGTMGKSDFDFDAQQRFNKDPVFSHPLIRSAVKGFEGYRTGSLGLAQALFDATGNDEYADIARQGIAESQRRTSAMGEKGDGLQRNFEGAISSIAQQLPALLAGVATGTEVVPLAAMFTQTFGQEYGQGRAQGLDGGQAATRAGIFGAFEVLGEKFGLGQTMQALKMAGRGAATKDIATVLAKGILKEIPGEQLTTLGQFLTDKVPGVGTNLEAGLAEYLQQAGDTLVQTVMQGGMMMGGTTGVSAGVRHLQGVQSQQSQALAADQARENALNKAATFFQPERPKHASQTAAEQVVRDMAADAGMDVSDLLPAEPVAAPTAPPAPVADPTAQSDAQDIDGLTNAVLAAEAAQGSADGTQPQPAVPADAVDPRGATPDAGVGIDSAAPGAGTVPGSDTAGPGAVQAPPVDATAVPGADGAADQQQALNRPAADEPPIAPGMTRLYHGGDVGRYDGPAWYSTSRDYANGYATKDGREGAEVQYVDYPTDKIDALADPDGYGQTPARGHAFNIELSSDETGPRRPLAATPLDAAAHAAATSPANDLPEPTDAQKAAGNYKMGHATVQGLDITIENPRGSTRSGTDAGGKAWSVDMANHYGYIKRTEGADGDHVDAFIGPNPDSTQVFVVDQVDPRTGKFDEHKVMLGFDSLDAARDGYLANYEQGWKGAAAITPMSMDEFKGWLKEGDTTKPLDAKTGRPRTEAQARAAREKDKPGTPTAPAKTEKDLKAERAAKKRTGAQAARDKLKAENPFLAFIGEFGLNPQDRKDLGQEKGQRAIPGYGFIWRNSAPRVDELAMLAMESGFLSQDDIDAAGDTGGTRKLAEMIQRAMAGEVEQTHDTAIDAAKARREAEYQEYLLQQKEAEQEAADERDAILYAERAAFDILDDADIPFDLTTTTDPANLTDDEIDRLFGFTAESRGGIQKGAAAPTGESAGNPAAPARAGPGSQGADEGLTLTSYTADDIRAQESEREAAAKAEAKAKRDADERARREQEQKELGDRRRQDASADNFELGQDPMEALSGQADIFSASPPAAEAPAEPAKKPKKKTEKQLWEERRAQQLADYFRPGNIVKGYIGFDEVIAYHPAADGKPMSVTVHEVKKVGDEWVRLGKPQDARTHMTVPTERELSAGPVDHVPDGEAAYTSPRGDGQPFPNAPRRGPEPVTEDAAPKTDRDDEALERDHNGHAERRVPLVGDERWPLPHKMGNSQKANELFAAQSKVVAYMNGDITRTEMLSSLQDSPLLEGEIYGITQRLENDAPNFGEVKAMLARRGPRTLEFRGVHYRQDGDGWQFSPDGQKWATVRSRQAREALDRGDDPNPADARVGRALDHGELNIPGRTNGINAELDRYKAQQEADGKAKRRADAVEKKTDKARAKDLFADHGEAIIAKHGDKLGAAELRKTLDSMVKWEPKKFIALAEKFLKEQQDAAPAQPKKVRKADVESTGHSMLATAQQAKTAAFRLVKELREAIKEAPVGEKSVLRLELIKAEDRWREYQRMETAANSKIAEDAAKQGVVFSRAPAAGSEAFRRWFGDSKVTRGGKPAVMYHSSDASFTVFDKEKLGSNTGHASAGLGFFTTPDRVSSERYGQHLMPVVVRMENPYRMGVNEFASFEDVADSTRRREELQAEGYDGIYVAANDTVIVFEPNQIKSATSNSGAFDNTNLDINLSRGAAGGQLQASAVRAMLAPIQAQWVNGPKGGVVVVQSVAELPESLADYLRSTGEDGRAEGFYLPKSDKVYLIADNLPSIARAQAVVFHEVYGHKGMRAFLQEGEYAAMMDRIRRANPKIARAADAWFDQYGVDTIMANRDAGQSNAEATRNAELLAVEEALADMAATQPAAGPVRKLLAALQAALRKMGLHAVADWMEGRSEAETFALLRAARDAVFGDTVRGDTHVAMAGEAPAYARADQPTGLPDAIIGGSLGSATSQADYAAAKAGDRVAGLSVAQALVTDDLVAKVKESIGDIKPIVVGVQSVEATGRNKIPLMASVVLADRLGATHSTDIVQANTPKRTGLNGLDRIFAAADFAGDVVAGGQYILVDDTLTQGGTFAALASHIEENGGKVVGIVALTGKAYSAKLTPAPETLQRLREKYGDIEQDFRAATGYGFDALTQSEARYLASFEPAQSVRDRILAAGKQDGRGVGPGATAPEVKGDGPLFSRAKQPVQHQTTLPLQGGTTAGPKWQAPDPTRLDRVVYELQNRQIDLKRVQTAIRETAGAIPEQFDGYLKEEVYHGRVATRTNKFLERELRPLLEDLRSRGVSMDQLEAFLWARHAAERNAQIATINPDYPDGGSGLTNKQAADYMAGADVKDSAGEIIIKGLDQAKAQDMKDLAARVDRMIAGTNQILIQYGLESPDTIAAWTGAYKHYVPLKREDMDGVTPIGQGFSVKGSASKRALGSSRKVIDILANISLAREAAITRGEKNRVTLSLYGLALTNPNPEFWTTDKPPMIKTIDQSTGLVVKRPDPTYKNKDNVVVLRVRGEDRAIAFNERDPRAMRIAETMKNLDVQPFGEILGTVASVTRFMAAINTQYNPVFGLLNGIRDVQGAALNLASTPIADKRAFVLANGPAALRAIWQAERHGNMSSPWAKLYDQLQLAGGTTGYREIFRAGKERTEALQREIDSMDRGAPRKVLDYMLNWLDHYNTSIENALRLTAFKAALDKGLSQERAASVAKNLTVNFNRKGRLGRELGAMYAFFNAAVQGTARMLQTLDPRTRHGKAIIIGGIMVGVVQALVGAAAMDDDDWESIPEFTKQRNFIIPLGKSYAMIPMPLGFNVLPNIGRILTDAISSGGAKWRDQIPDLLSVLLDNANPIGSGTFAQILAPTVADPIIALAENKDFTGRQIFKEDANAMRPKPGFQRSKDTASTLSKGIAYGANWASGGTDYTPGLVSPTPDQLDYIFGTITGGLGREFNKVYQTGELMAKGKDVPEYKKPIFGRFYGDFEGDGNVAGRYWNVVREVNEKRNELAGRQKDGGDAAGYLAAHPELRLIKAIEKTQSSIGKLNKAKDQIELNPNLRETDRTAQMDAIDKQITKMMQSVVTMSKETRKK